VWLLGAISNSTQETSSVSAEIHAMRRDFGEQLASARGLISFSVALVGLCRWF